MSSIFVEYHGNIPNKYLGLQTYKKTSPVGTVNANLHKQCANLVNMPDWLIWIKCSEITWGKNFWSSFRHE